MGFSNLSVKLTADIKDFSAKMSEAVKHANKVRSTLASGMSTKANNMIVHATTLGDKYREATKELKSHNLGLKDTARIIQGIMVAQAFYGIAGAIRSALSALWEFNVALDYMKVTYSALFGSTQKAEDFMGVLQEHSIETIFDYQTLADASKKLLAYGIEYKNLMFVMEGLTNLGAMSGDPQALDRISLALGQIYTKGKLGAEEMRQLANAYIPITDILQDKFGLTGDDLKRVGDLNLPAADVINAIVDYANENFASVGDAAMYTITGVQSRIVDTLKVTGSQMLSPITSAYKSFLTYISSGLENIRAAYASGGMGGILEYLIPDESRQQVIRQFLANVRNLLMSLVSVGKVVGKVFSSVWHVFVAAFNVLAPILTVIINLLSGFLYVVIDTIQGTTVLRAALVAAALAFLILKAQALGALIITKVTAAVAKLSAALLALSSLISKHPILAFLTTIGVMLIGTASSADKANAALSKLFGGLGSTKGDDVFDKTKQDVESTQDALDQFNERLEQGSENADELGDSIGGAANKAKKAKDLLSFDEVFKLPDSSEDSDSDYSYNPDLGEGGMAGLINGLGDALIPEVPDFTSFINEFTDDLFGGLMDKIKKIASGAATGAFVGALAGFAIGALITKSLSGGLAGAKLGAKIGAAAGGAFAAIWTDAYAALEQSIQEIAVVGAAGALLGGLAGFIIGAFATKTLAGAVKGAEIGIAVGAAIGGTIGGIFDGAAKELERRIKQIMQGSAIGTLTGGVAGFIIGAFATKTLKGAIAGGSIGAGIGTAIGGIIDGIFGDAESTVSDALSRMFSNVAAASYGAFVGGLGGMIIGAVIGSMALGIGALPGAKVGATIGAAAGSLAAMLSEYLRNSGVTDAITQWFGDLFSSIGQWFVDLGNAIAGWWKALFDFSKWVSAWECVKGWFSNLFKDIGAWFTSLGNTIAAWWKELFNFSRWATAWMNVKGWFSQLWTDIGNWFAGLGKGIADIWNGLFDPTKWKSAWECVSKWFKDFTDAIVLWFGQVKKTIKDLWAGLWSGLTGGDTPASTAGVTGKVAMDIFKAFLIPGKQYGHATGGVFNREHIARFAEGNKAEAIIPLENRSAMQPFVDAVSDGIIASLGPVVAQGSFSNSSNLPPLYVGTLIADDRGIRELYKKFEIIQVQESARRGTPVTL